MDNAPAKVQKFTYDIIYCLLWVVEAFLFLRFLFKLLGANPYNEIIAFIYSASQALMGPFYGMFQALAFGGTVVFEPSTLVAMVGYALIAYVLISFIRMLGVRTTPMIG